MLDKYKILMGYDDRGTVFDADNFVLREVLPQYQKNAKKVYSFYEKFNLHKIGIVKTELDALHGDNCFRHEKHLITYPHEWPADMLKDAALFHLNLFLDLEKLGMGLKDAHPHNILFDNNSFVFVDFLSLALLNELKTEQSLIEFAGSKDDSRFSEPRLIVFDEMFLPEILIPLTLMARKQYAQARHIVCYRGRNLEGKVPGWDDLYNCSGNKKYLSNLIEVLKFKWFLKRKRRLMFADFCSNVKHLIEGLDVKPVQNIYDTYYQDKKENFSFELSSEWTDKQKNIYNVLKCEKPATVLDLGANTGWFSILAAKGGAKVIATDIEESSINLLYLYVKKNNLNIIPLLLPFENLTKDVYGAYDQRLDFKDPRKNPIFMAGIRRLQSDVVLFLALIHHLVLGGVVDLEKLFKVLSDLTKRVLVLEYVDLDDSLIKLNPSSFTYNRENYSLQSVVGEAKKHFKDVEIFESSASTRKILAFKK